MCGPRGRLGLFPRREDGEGRQQLTGVIAGKTGKLRRPRALQTAPEMMETQQGSGPESGRGGLEGAPERELGRNELEETHVGTLRCGGRMEERAMTEALAVGFQESRILSLQGA